MTDNEIEQEIQAKNLTAPRVRLADIEAEITDSCYWQPSGTTVTVILVKFKNGFTVVGHSAAVSEANFDRELGEKIAYQHAIDQCWALFGFRLRSALQENAE
jgi:hypothetical protein